MLPIVLQFILARVNKRQSGIILENLIDNTLRYLFTIMFNQNIIFAERGITGFNPSLGQVIGTRYDTMLLLIFRCRGEKDSNAVIYSNKIEIE